MNDPSLDQPQKHLPVGQEVHVPPRDPRLAGVDHGQAGPQDGVVDELLLLGELAVGRVGAGDVRAEAVVLPAHVEEDDVAVLDGLHGEQSYHHQRSVYNTHSEVDIYLQEVA